MFYPQQSTIKNIAIHSVGNKSLDEFYLLSGTSNELTEQEEEILLQYLPKPFVKSNEVYHLFHPNQELELNPVYHFVSAFFNEQISFSVMSQELAKHLYEVSVHPKIKKGDFIVVHFSNIMMDGEESDAVGIYKIDNKDISLKINLFSSGFELNILRDSIDLNNLEKSAIIINSNTDIGYTVLSPKIPNSLENAYWKDEFLQVIGREDSYFKTKKMLELTKDFIINKLDEVFDLNQVDKADLLNESIAFFKKHEQFEQEEFVQDVFNNDTVSGLFASYITTLQEEYDLQPLDDFEISNNAVQSAQKSFKKVLKLDKNFQVHIHGTKDLIESGYDDQKGMNYYKLYFDNEH